MKVETTSMTIHVVTLTYDSELSHWIYDNPENEDLADRINDLESIMRVSARTSIDVFGDKSVQRFEFDGKRMPDLYAARFRTILAEAQARFDANKENTDEC